MTSVEVRDGETTIGRSRESGLFVDHGSVSRRHAVLRVAGSAWHIEDLGSANGTFVGGPGSRPARRSPWRSAPR